MKEVGSVLFICHGNICRSPMAEFVMRDLIEKRGMHDLLRIASAATHDDVIGAPVHPGTCKILKAQGISCENKIARRLRPRDADNWDLLVAMDEANVQDVKRQLGRAAKGKLRKLLDFTDEHGRDVADPWVTGDFETTYADVLAGCTGLLAYVTGSHHSRGRHRAVRS